MAAQKLGQLYGTVAYRCKRNLQVDGYEYKLATFQQVELPGEEWRPMIDPNSGTLVGGRMVSSRGRIKSKSGRISFGTSKDDGYVYTRTKVATKVASQMQWRTHLVHRLVAASFLGPPPSPVHSQINHKDGKKSNNAVDNLEYATPAENNAHRSANLKGPHPLWKAVLSRAYGTNEEWTHHPSVTSAAKTLGLHTFPISNCARGKRRQSGGYEFRYAEPEPDVVETLPGEVWRDVDLKAHFLERQRRPRSLE